ncbi:MAG: histidine--tRNA ligase [Candidatus Omnitrophota bacterium]
MKEKRIKAPRGMADLFFDDAVLRQRLENTARDLFDLYGFSEIRTPILEETALFTRSIGDATDIVSKEMFSFTDRGERNLSLRPEGTAPVVRSYIENDLGKKAGLCKLYYAGPMFRSERPQAGRLRQFYQLGVEVIGSASPYADAEVMILMMELLQKLGLDGAELKLNSLGCADDKEKFNRLLKKELSGQKSALCKDCQARFDKNILRIFDCKNESCKRLLRAAPDMLEHICGGCRDHFDKVKEALSRQKVGFTVDPRLVRGLDYYTQTAFEVTHKNLGSQNAVGAGGRYDKLVRELGGPDAPACGFAVGLDRIALALDENKKAAVKAAIKVFVVPLGGEAQAKGFSILQELRKQGIAAEMDYDARSLKAQMRRADKSGADYAVIIGEDELKKGAVIIRNMKDKSQRELGFGQITDSIKGL